MLSLIGHPMFLLQLPLAQAGQLLLIVGISFAVITLVYSTARFQTMINFSGDDLQTVQDFNDFFFIQVTRYLSRINRSASGFGVVLVQLKSDTREYRETQNLLADKLTSLTRDKTDKICLYREDCVAAIVDTGNENMEATATRIVQTLKNSLSELSDISAIKAGVSCFPSNGSSTQEIIDCSVGSLDSVDFDTAPLPLFIAEINEEEAAQAEEESSDEESSEKEDKHSSLDPLTGVLKPDVVGSYMRKYLSELRYKKQSVSILCVGINSTDEISSLHGPKATDTIIAGVSQVLQDLTRETDLIGRFQQNDFLMLIPTSIEDGEKIANRLRETVQRKTFSHNGRPLRTSISIGITGYPEHGRVLRDLFRGSYAALEVIRDWDTSACLVYDPAQHDKKVRYAKEQLS